MVDLELAFELGKIVYKTLREVDSTKEESGKLLRTLGGAQQEEILLQKIAKYWNQQRRLDRPNGLLVVTNHRVVFLAKIKTVVTTTDYLSFPIEMIEDLKATRAMLVSPAIRFRVREQDQVFTLLSNAEKS
ncbi:MAG: hypothetical protein ACR2GP_16025 [Burkholderiaceae bacterium]